MITKLIILAQIIEILQSKFQIISPTDLQKQFNESYPSTNDTDAGSLNYSHANFGINPYGQVLKGYIMYPPINNNSESKSTTGCQPLVPLADSLMMQRKTFLMVDRGDCSFVSKASYAQQFGASVLVIADNDKSDHAEQHILVPDNDGSNIKIPTIMLNYNDSQLIKERALKGEEVYVRFEVEHPQRTNEITIEYWMKLFSPSSFEFLSQLKDFYQDELNINERDMIQFSPNYEIWYCYGCSKENPPYQNPNQDCISGGKYCQIDPDGSDPKSLVGADVINEIIRQVCIHQNTNILTYLNYMLEFRDQVIKDYFSSKKDKMKEIFNKFPDEERAKINKCVDDSYEESLLKNKFADNKIMRQMRDLQLYRESEFASFPALGDIFQAEATYEFICEAMLNPARNCSKYDRRKAYGIDEPLEQIDNNGGEDDTNYTGLIIGIVIGSIAIFGLFLFFCRRLLKKDLQRQVQGEANQVIQNYFQMREDSKQ